MEAFILDRELFKAISYAMENISEPSVFDWKSKKVVLQINAPLDSLPLPIWQSQDGYELMESFAKKCSNPLLKSDLVNILESGRGVFREFKKRIKENSLYEKQWYAHKDETFREIIRSWYKNIHLEFGLEPLEEDLGDADFAEELLLDVQFITNSVDNFIPLTTKFFDICLVEDDAPISHILSILKNHQPSYVFSLESQNEIYGILLTIEFYPFHLIFYAIEPEFRSIGLGKLIIQKSLEELAKKNIRNIMTYSLKEPDIFAEILKSFGDDFIHHSWVARLGI